jgi:hypothetical protein
MKEIITNAFKSLEDLVESIEIEPVKKKVLKEETEEEVFYSVETLEDLFIQAGSYVLTHDFEHEGTSYSIFLEGLNEGQAADVLFDEFDVNNITDILIEILDEERNFVDSLLQETSWWEGLNTPVSVLEDMAKAYISGDLPIEETLQPAGFTESVGKSEFFPGQDGDLAAGDFIEKHGIKDYRIEWDGEKGGYLLSWEGSEVVQEDVETKEETKEELTESEHFSIKDVEEAEKAKEIIDSNKEEEAIEQIVDVNAETVADLKKTYIGSTILQCSVCRTLIYKDPKDLSEPETVGAGDNMLYNIGEDCPHCGAKDGYELVGQVAALDVDPNKEQEPPMVEPVETEMSEEEPTEEKEDEEESPFEAVDETEREVKPKRNVTTIPEEEMEESVQMKETTYEDVILEEVDDKKFDRLTRRYLNEVYDNIKSYQTKSIKVDNELNTIIVEGNITFKSGVIKPTKFVFEAREITKRGKIKFIGVNETFTTKKAFTLVGSLNKNNLLSESLTYSYRIQNKKVYGQVKNPTKI